MTKKNCIGIAIILFIIAFLGAVFFNCKNDNVFAENEIYSDIPEQDNDLELNEKDVSLRNGNSSNPIAYGAIDLNISIPSGLSNISYIPNENYFKNNPRHFPNDSSAPNIGGVCTTVALQLLMGYHNYYSDRRLIPEMVGNKNFLDASCYGDNSSDPEINSIIAPGQGDYSLGTTDAFFQELFDLTVWGSFPVLGQNLFAVTNAACSFVNTYASAISTNVTIECELFSESTAQTEINCGRPIVLGFNPISAGGGKFHVIVAYGTAVYNGSFGFICHYGWGDAYTNIWIPSSWFGFETRMSVGHSHNFSYGEYDNHYKVGNCSVCQASLLKRIFKTDSTGTIITGLNWNYEGSLDIPSVSYDSVPITQIGDEAFYGRKRITSVVIPNTVTYLGKESFKNCTGLTSVSIPSSITDFRSNVFFGCTGLMTVNFSNALQTIGKGAFYDCSALTSLSLPGYLNDLGESAFAFTKIKKINIPYGLTTIKELTFLCSGIEEVFLSNTISSIDYGAFAFCSHLKKINIGNNVINIGDLAFFSCSSLQSVELINPSLSVGDSAFSACSGLTIYTTFSNGNGWGLNWNESNRPVIWGCNMDSSNKYIYSFEKTDVNPINIINVSNGISDPSRSGYLFNGWSTESDGSGTIYTGSEIYLVPNGTTLYSKWSSTSSCVAEGTLITLADGSQVAVEDLTGEENLLVWNMLTGEYDAAPMLFIDSDPSRVYEVIELTFSDGTVVKVIDEHAFFDMTTGEYVFLRNDAAQYIGHYFNKQGANGTWASVQLTGVNVHDEVTTAWSPVTYGHLCYYVNGMLSMPGATEGFINIFEVDTSLMQYDEDLMEEDILTYGLYTYEEFNAIIPLPELVFEAFNGQYLKVSIGKGLITFEEIAALLSRYAVFFN